MLYFSIQNARGGLKKDWRFYNRIMVGAVSDRPHIINNVLSVFTKLLLYFGRVFFVAGAIFGEVGQ